MTTTQTAMDLAFYNTDEGVLPDAARQPWTLVGAGGTLSARNTLRITATSALNYYWRQAVPQDNEATAPVRLTDRLEVQARFRGIANGSANVSGHLLVVDDGERSAAVALGSSLAFVNPATGATLLSIVTSWGFTRLSEYRLVKVGTTSWDLYADGRLLGRLPYEASAATFLPAAGVAFGWFDAATNGSADWQDVEAGTNTVLPPHWMVDRIRTSMPTPMQSRWTGRHRALVRAMVGTSEAIMDASRRAAEDHTAAVLPWGEASFSGETDPVDSGWSEVGAAFPGSIVRQRARISGGTTTHSWQYDFGTPPDVDDFVMWIRARIYLRSFETDSAIGRVGPFLQLQNGHRSVTVALFQALHQRDALGWRVTDEGPASTALGNGGEFLHYAQPDDPEDGSLVELYITGRDRVILFVDGVMCEDVDYTVFTTASSNYYALVGRGAVSSAVGFTSIIDVEDVEAAIEYADLHQRPAFLHRINERLLFAGGCERNDTLDTWSRHRPGVFAVRGTGRVISEIRRLSCDEDAAIIEERQPGEWFLEVTYPEVTPIFLEADGDVLDAIAEFQALAPNFQPDELVDLIEYYLLPRSVVEAAFSAALVTVLDVATVTGATTTFSVERATGFEAGNPVLLRGPAAGAQMAVQYDVAGTATDRGVRDLSGGGNHGTLSAGGALSTDFPDAEVTPSVPGTTQASVSTSAFTPNTGGGDVTIALWVEWDTGTDLYLWSTIGTADGGIYLRVDGSNNLELTIINSIGVTQVVSYASLGLSAQDWVHITVKVDVSAGPTAIKTYADGVALTAGDAPTLTPATPTTPGFRAGADPSDAKKWRQAYRDVWCWDRSLSDAEILALATNTRLTVPRDFWTETSGNEPQLIWVPGGYQAPWARWDPIEQAERVKVATFNQQVWSDFEASADGMQGSRAIEGSFDVGGRDGDKVNNIVAGEVVKVSSSGGTATGIVEIFGIATTSGLPESEIVVLSGTVTATTLWDEVHGATIDGVQGVDVFIDDQSNGNRLYTISSGNRASGVHLFDPPLRCGPKEVSFVADGATVADFIIAGHVEGSADEIHVETLAGTTPVTTSEIYISVRALAMGYVQAARTVSLEAVFCDPAGVVRVRSNNAADDMQIYVVYEDADGDAAAEVLTLNGTTNVDGSGNPQRFLGLTFAGPAAAGVLAVEIATGQVTITVGGVAAGLVEFGARRMALDLIGDLEFRIDDTLTTTHFLGFLGLDEAGDRQVEVVDVAATGWQQAMSDWTRLVGIFTGDIPDDRYIRLRGALWSFDGARTTVRGLADLSAWTATATSVLDLLLDNDSGQNAALGAALTFSGSGSNTEETTITTIDADTGDVVTPAIAGSFPIGSIMRKRGS